MNPIFFKYYKKLFIPWAIVLIINLGITIGISLSIRDVSTADVSITYLIILFTIVGMIPIINTAVILPYYIGMSKSRIQYLKDSTKFNLIITLVLSILGITGTTIVSTFILKTSINGSKDIKNILVLFLFLFSLTSIISFISLVFRRFSWTWGLGFTLFFFSPIIYFMEPLWDSIFWKREFLLYSTIFFIIGIILLIASNFVIKKIEIR